MHYGSSCLPLCSMCNPAIKISGSPVAIPQCSGQSSRANALHQSSASISAKMCNKMEGIEGKLSVFFQFFQPYKHKLLHSTNNVWWRSWRCVVCTGWLKTKLTDFWKWILTNLFFWFHYSFCICAQSHQNDAHVGSYMLLIYSFYLCPYFCPLSRELSNDEA